MTDVTVRINGEDNLSGVTDKAAGSMRELESTLNLAKQAFSAVSKIIVDTIKEVVDYGNTVSDMSLILGTNARETSTLIQIADDLRISEGELTMAFRNAAKDGITPNIETLIKLGGQYRAIEDPAERLNFVMETFGARGTAMARILQLDAEQLRTMAAEAEAAGLIVGDDFVGATANAYAAMDTWEDSVQGLKIAFFDLVGPGFAAFVDGAASVIRAGTGILGGIADMGMGMDELYAKTWEVIYTDLTWADVINEVNESEANRNYLLPQVTAAIEATSAATVTYTGLLMGAAAASVYWAQKETEAAAAADAVADAILAQDFQTLNDYINGTLGPTIEAFNVTQGELATQMDAVKGKIIELESRAYLTEAQRGELSDLRGEYDDLSTKFDENATAHEEATARILFGILSQKIAMGDYGQAGQAILETAARNWGLVDDATVGATLAADDVITALESDNMVNAMAAVYDLGEAFGVASSDATGASASIGTSGAAMALALEPPAALVSGIVSGLGVIDGMDVDATVTISEGPGSIPIDYVIPRSPPPIAKGMYMIADAAREMSAAFGSIGGISIGGIEEMMGFAGGLSSAGSGLIGQFTDRTLDPLKDKLDFATDQTDELFSLFADEGYSSIQQLIDAVGMFGDTVVPPELRDELAALLAMDEQRAAIAEEYAHQQQIVIDLQRQQQELQLIQQQMDLMDMIAEYGLDPSSILGGMELGAGADIGALLEALTRAMEAIVAQLAESAMATSGGGDTYSLVVHSSAPAESALSDFQMMKSLAGA